MAKTKTESAACAACRMQRKKCSEQCILASHFPSDDPEKFAMVHRVFGTGNIIKMLQGVEDSERAEAVNSMVYEASARLKDPVHGTGTAIHQLMQKITDLQNQLAATQKELMNMRCENDKLVFLCNGTSHPFDNILYEEGDHLQCWGSLWDE
ncbi:hypothetical protein KI387_002854 [Taxus chinensis]|uniref:LOB domain-containing protein n=1 Tax=Taxus chinensis TaxID=29808 RepID=A0AA38GY27_TAXCH|nr:hypothetical protein KI387_002854 [Taxus chinensis]